MKHLTTFVCVAFLAAVVLAQSPVVQTKNGRVQGIVSTGVRKFLGIPFAQPPVGSLRWSAPLPAKSWAPNTLKALQFSAGCIQRCSLPPKTCPPVTSEDCLYLNVYAPLTQAATTPQPVMVFFHGGRYEQGAAGTILYDGTLLTNTSNVLIVTTNYRVGAMGWLTVNDDITGSYGYLDQVLALQWVQENIAAFGGDPKQVTIFGQSAGASSVAVHLMAAKSQGLFSKAIMESHPAQLPLRPLADALQLGKFFAQAIGCAITDSACLRSKNTTQVLDAQKAANGHVDLVHPIELFMPWTPVVDGKLIMQQPIEAFRQGKFANVPMIIGTVSQEAHPFIYLAANFSFSDVLYTGACVLIFGTDSWPVMEMYPPVPFVGDKRPQLGVLGSDYIFDCTNRNMSVNAFLHSKAPIYTYQFDHALSFNEAWGPEYWFCYGVVCHGAELPFLWNTARFAGYNPTNQEIYMSEQMGMYWTNFARSGNPNVGTLMADVNWPAYNPTSAQTMHFATPQNNVISHLLEKQCNFWDNLGYHYGWMTESKFEYLRTQGSFLPKRH